MRHTLRMRLAVISDVHANVDALRAVLGDLELRGARQILCLGDLVGYNAFPRETITLVRDRGIPAVYGNHDLMALGWVPVEGGPQARAAIDWTREILTASERDYLAGLPGALRPQGAIIGVHSALDDPLVRIEQPAQFHQQYLALTEHDPHIRLCFTGHSHVPELVVVQPTGEVVRHPGDGAVKLRASAFAFVNPGSVGHPRGSDWRASYVLFDVETRRVEFRRVAYDRSRVLAENARHRLIPEPEPSVLAGLRAAAARFFNLDAR